MHFPLRASPYTNSMQKCSFLNVNLNDPTQKQAKSSKMGTVVNIAVAAVHTYILTQLHTSSDNNCGLTAASAFNPDNPVMATFCYIFGRV